MTDSCLKIDNKKIEEALISLEFLRFIPDAEDTAAGRVAWNLFRAKWKKAITICNPDERTFLHAFVQGCKWIDFKKRELERRNR